jgi:hypothetical protein
MNLFDGLQATMFSTVTNTMGYDATWTPSSPDGSSQQSARVLYQGPTHKEKLIQADFDPDKLDMEYQLGDFENLKSFADENIFETVDIDGIGSFKVKSVLKKFDGKSFVARLQPVQ